MVSVIVEYQRDALPVLLTRHHFSVRGPEGKPLIVTSWKPTAWMCLRCTILAATGNGRSADMRKNGKNQLSASQEIFKVTVIDPGATDCPMRLTLAIGVSSVGG